MSRYNEIEKQLISVIDDLEDEAKRIVGEHWEYHIENNADLKPRHKAKLNCWCRRRGNGLEIYWTYFRFQKPLAEGQKSKPKTFYIKKGRLDRYPAKSLERHAMQWESDFIQEIEDRLAQIRREYRWVSKQLLAVTHAKKAQKERMNTQTKTETKEVAYEQ